MDEITAGDVIACAESARANGATFLARELIGLAEEMLADVDHESSAATRLAIEAIGKRLPSIELHHDAAELRHAVLTGGRN